MAVVFEQQSLFEILQVLRAELAAGRDPEFLVPDPERGLGSFSGERVGTHIHRPLRLWLDVADRLECHLRTPIREGAFVRLQLVRRAIDDAEPPADDTEKYGAGTRFGRVRKLEEVCFLEDALEALARVKLAPGARILDVGVNSGEELALLELAAPGVPFEVVGLDHSASAIGLARQRFPQHRFEVMDLATLPRPEFGRFNLILSIATLQSPGLNQDAVFRALAREHLAPGGAFILGFPNCRYEDGEVTYGARMKNFRRPDLSLLVKDLAYYRRYFQRHDFQVFITGKYDVFVTAVPVR